MIDHEPSRRRFLESSLAAAAAALAGRAAPSSAPYHWGAPPEEHDGADAAADRHHSSAARIESPHPPSAQPGIPDELTLADIRAGLESGRFTARRLAEHYLARIDALDRRGEGLPAPLRSVIEVNPDALAIADRMDAERRERGPRGALHGVPVLIKDNIATADRMETTAGSLALVGVKPPRDAFIVERLRAAGAVILGKTNLSEWANFRSTHSSSGWSARGGQCRNPYALDRSPSGSSSGSGIAVAANLCAVAVGTETDGSITSPAAACSIVGVKPTIGLVSRSGIIPIAHSQDTAGPMTRTVADAALLLAALAAPDPRDRPSATPPGRPAAAADYAAALDPAGLKGARIGVPRERFYGYSRHTDRIMRQALDVMKAAGATIVDPAPLPHAGEYDGAEFEVLLYEFKADIAAYLAEWAPGAPVKTLADLIAFNERHADREMPYFGQEIFEQAQKKGPLSSAAYRAARAKCVRMSRAEGIDAVMTRLRLDALVAPTQGAPWPIDLYNGDHFIGGATTPAAVAGYPSIAVPAGFADGLPVGLMFFGRAWSEPTLLKLAYAYEQASRVRRPPEYRDSVG